MRAELLNALLFLAVAAVAAVAAYGALGAPVALPAGLQTAIAVLWALWPLAAAWGALGAALWWVYGWLAGKW